MKTETQDLYCGAYIMSKGGYLHGTRQEPGKNGGLPSVFFIFTGQNVMQLKNEFFSGQGNIDALRFKAALVHLRDVMFNVLRKQKRRS